MDDLFDGRFIQILILVVVVFVAIARHFYRLFVKPFVPPNPPGSAPGQSPPILRGSRQHEIKDFLEELRRDLGHGEGEPARSGGLMDEEKPGVGYLEKEWPAREEATRGPAAPIPEVPRPFQPQPARQVPRPRPATPAERAMRQEAATRAAEGARRAAHREENSAMEKIADVLLEKTAREKEVTAAVALHSLAPIESLAPLGAQEAGVDSVLGVDLERAVILQQVLGPPHCRRPRRSKR